MEISKNYSGMLNLNYINNESKFEPDMFGCISKPLNLIINDNYTVTIDLNEIENDFPTSLKWMKIVEEKFYSHISVESHLVYEQDEITLKVTPGVKYWYRIYTPLHLEGDVYVYESYYECVLTKSDIKKLFTKSCELFAEIKISDTKIEQLYRCKTESYFERIKIYNQGIMYPYIKDNTGHSGNPLIGNVRGLFFSGQLINGDEFPKKNPYGNKRFVIDAHKLLNPDIHNYYFCDFYCTKDVNTHIITIVVCKKNTPEDGFCKNHLVNLPHKDNEFLYCIPENNTYAYYWNWSIKNNNYINYEVFYCGKVDINDGKIEDVVEYVGNGTTPGGIGHIKGCKICNI